MNGLMTRREFNQKILKSLVYTVMVFIGVEALSLFQKKTFRNSCAKDYYCLRRCPFKAITLDTEGYPKVNKKKCVAYNWETKRFKWRKCGLCLRGCPTRALEVIS